MGEPATGRRHRERHGSEPGWRTGDPVWAGFARDFALPKGGKPFVSVEVVSTSSIHRLGPGRSVGRDRDRDRDRRGQTVEGNPFISSRKAHANFVIPRFPQGPGNSSGTTPERFVGYGQAQSATRTMRVQNGDEAAPRAIEPTGLHFEGILPGPSRNSSRGDQPRPREEARRPSLSRAVRPRSRRRTSIQR
jgi:hypothetical protein